MINFNRDESDNYTDTLFARYLYRNLNISVTRCESLDLAISKLHSAFSYCDVENRKKLENMTVKELLAIYGAIESANDFEYFTADEKDQLLRIQDGLRYTNSKCAIAVDNGLITKDATEPFERVIEYKLVK
tara:strand:+ start:493 stop:885 length:393 start_codon:yes stop_codon:yes gene_type:complete